ncbi:MAG: GlxA family transcriptional regulator [Thermoanaerobaculia bacterium]
MTPASRIDLALAIVEEHHGPLVAARVAREMVVYIRRSGEQRQASIYLDYRTHVNNAVHRVQDFLVTHPEEGARLSDLARLVHVSQRHLTRVFRRETGLSTKRFAARVKAQFATDLLRGSQLSIEEVAGRCGFQDSRQLRRLIKQAYGTTPMAFRRANRPTVSA